MFLGNIENITCNAIIAKNNKVTIGFQENLPNGAICVEDRILKEFSNIFVPIDNSPVLFQDLFGRRSDTGGSFGNFLCGSS